MIGCAAVGAWLRIPEDGSFKIWGGRGFEPSHAESLDRHVVPAEVAEQFLFSKEQPFVLPGEVVATVPRYLALPEPAACLVAPMRWEPDGFGVLVIVGARPGASFSDRDIALAGGIADITSLALGNARRFADLEAAYVSTVEALANAVEAKDEYTSDHCRALAELSLTVGRELGLEGERLKSLELGALLHDIGKIGVRSDIIRKATPLKAAERREMNRHPEIGAQILSPVPFLAPIRPIVEASHERWDGAGIRRAWPGRRSRSSRASCSCATRSTR